MTNKSITKLIVLFMILLVMLTSFALAIAIQDVYDPLFLNRYSYARNNPIKYTDDTGHCPMCLVAAGIAAWTIGGATVAAGIDYLYQVGWQDRSLFEGTIDWGSVGKSAAVGGAAIGAGSLGFSLFAPAMSLVGPELVVGGTGIAAYSAGQATHNALSGNELSSGLDDNSLATAYAGSIAAGGILSKVGSWVGGGRSGSISTKIPEMSFNKLPQNVQKTITQIKQGKTQHLNPHIFENRPYMNGKHLLPVNKDPAYYTTHYIANEPRTMQNRIITGRGGEVHYTPDHYRTIKTVVEDMTK